MAKINSKNKGNTYERKISTTLSDRFADYTGIKKSFRRNADSGSFFGASNIYRKDEYDTSKATFGDIITPEHFNYSIECKHYKEAPKLGSILNQKVADWDSWIKQAEQDSSNSDKKVLLIVKYNNVDEMVFIKDLINDHDPILIYKGYNVYKLTTFLNQDNSIFFTEEDNKKGE